MDDPTAARLPFITLGQSLETAALGASKNPAAETSAYRAISAALDDNAAALRAHDRDSACATLNQIRALGSAELAHQLSGETPDEQATIADYVVRFKAEARKFGELLQREQAAKDAAAKAKTDAEASRAQMEVNANAKAEADRSRIEAEAKAKIEAEKAQIEADAKATVRAKIEADLRAKAVADATAKAEAEAKDDIEKASKAKDEVAAAVKANEDAPMEAEAVARQEEQVLKDKAAADAKVRADRPSGRRWPALL